MVEDDIDRLIDEIFRKSFPGKVGDVYAFNVLAYGVAVKEGGIYVERGLSDIASDAGHGDIEGAMECIKYLRKKGLVEFEEPLKPDSKIRLTELGRRIVGRIEEMEGLEWELPDLSSLYVE